VRQARNDARGAALGSLGGFTFAVVVATTVTRWPLWASLTAAVLAWTVVAMGSYAIARRLGFGGDE
jgi:hypothetical protein